MAFNVFNFVTDQIDYAERRPVVYMNGRAAQQINDLREQVAGLPDAKARKVKAEIKELQKELDKSKLTFHVRGFSPRVKTVIEETVREEGEKNGWSDSDIENEITYRVFAKAIVSVTSPDGEVDDQSWTPEQVSDFLYSAPPGSLKQFTEDVVHVTVRAIEFDKSVDVTF